MGGFSGRALLLRQLRLAVLFAGVVRRLASQLVWIKTGLVAGMVAVPLALLVVGMRWKLQPVLNAVRRINRSVTNPRVMGYVFNPASFYLCHDGARLAAVLVEVHNTHGERHLYPLVPAADDAPGRLTSGMSKAFYVSPFLGMEATYRVLVRDERDRLVIAIEEREGGERMLATSLVLERRPLTDRALVGLLTRRPLVPLRTIAWIHWHALRLWLRGAPFRRHRTAANGGEATRPEASAHGGWTR